MHLPSHSLELRILGTGAGQTHVYSSEASSSAVITYNGRPLVLLDVGCGTVAAFKRHLPGEELPLNLVVSHNHTDHAGELPVIAAVERSKGRRIRLHAHERVLDRLIEHRLHELQSTGKPMEHFVEPCPLQAGRRSVICSVPDHPLLELSICPVKSSHSELCYGGVLYLGDSPVLGWSADSGADEHLTTQLSVAPTVLLDARLQGSTEHASFAEAEEAAKSICKRRRGCSVYITGYGRQDEKGTSEQQAVLQHCTFATPGQCISLSLEQLPAACQQAEHEGTPAARVLATA